MTDVFRVQVRGAGRSAREFDDLQRAIQDELIAELRGLGRFAEEEFRRAAPGDTGDLRDRIRAVPFFGRAARPRVTIRVDGWTGHLGEEGIDPDFADAAVTRFGHRRTRIYPKRGAVLKVHYAGHRNPEVYAYAPSVRGSRPTTDWAELGAIPVESAADRSARALARRFETRVLR